LVGSSFARRAGWRQERRDAAVRPRANRRSLETIIDLTFEQKLIPRRFSVDELFDETTRGLS
jgi:hypothetical protein